MATYQYKGADIVTPFTISSNQPMFETTTVSLKTQRASQNAQRWELSFTTVNTNDDVAEMFIGLIDNLDTVESMIMPQLVQNYLVGATPRSNAAAIGDTSITLSNTGSVSGDFKQGQFIQFSNHDKVYVVTENASSQSTVPIFPALTTAVSSTEVIKVGNSVNFKYLRSLDTINGITYTDGLLSSPGTITLIEAL